MSQSNDQTTGFPMAVVVEGGLAMAALLLGWLFSVPFREQFPDGIRPLIGAMLRGIVATIPMLLMFWWLVHSRRPAWRKLREQVEWVVGELFPSGSLAQFALVALLAGVGEELLFRGLLQTVLVRWTTPAVGVLIGGLLFGAAHALSPLYFVLATLIGMYFGWLTYHHNDLIAPMTAHALYDFVALAYLSRNRARNARR
jgi:uncharacterized protein